MRDLTPLPEQYILSARKAPSSVTPTRSQGCRNAEPPGGEKGGGLSTNVKFAVGVTIRPVAIVIGFCILSFFLIRKRRRSRSELASTPVAQAGEGQMLGTEGNRTRKSRASWDRRTAMCRVTWQSLHPAGARWKHATSIGPNQHVVRDSGAATQL